MNIRDKINLITGAGSRIGFELAKQFIAKGNKVIICGRNEQGLLAAQKQLNNADYIVCDINSDVDLEKLILSITDTFGCLDLLVNNAGTLSAYHLSEKANAFDKAKEEILTNYLSVVKLTEKLLPLLLQRIHLANPY